MACFALGFWSAPLSWRILLLVPFLTGLSLSLLRLLPFGRTRHSAIVSIIIAAGVALAAQRWLAHRPRPWALASPLLAVLCFATAGRDFMDRPDSQLDRTAFREAAAYVGSLASPSVPILATGEARLLVQYYRLLQHQAPIRIVGDDFAPLQRSFFEHHFASLRRDQTLAPGQPLYFVDANYFPVEFPNPSQAVLLRRYGLLSVWSVPPPDTATGLPPLK
jgi:hypothetical protein